MDVEELKQKAVANKNELAAFMITYPSTHGVYEEGVDEICKIIHDNGGQVYMDGANMNAQVIILQRAKLHSCVILTHQMRLVV